MTITRQIARKAPVPTSSGAPPRPNRLRQVHRSRLDRTMLVSLVALVMLMPVSYRAGADVSHSHTVFQGLIDAITGQPHQHHGSPADDSDHSHARRDARHPGTAPEREQGLIEPDHHSAERLEPKHPAPDMPTWLGLSTPIDATAAIHALGALLAAMLGGSARRSTGEAVRRLAGLCHALEPPPPRPA